MNKNLHKELLLAAAIVVIFIISLIFYGMHPMMYFAVYAIVAALFVALSVFIWRSDVTDERDQAHRATASDIAFTLTGLALGFAMLYQLLIVRAMDMWLPIVLVVMVVSRVAARVWLEKNR